MHYRIAVPVLALVALAACSGEKVTSNVPTAPGPAMVVEHTTLKWSDASGALHQMQTADRLVPEVIAPRGGGTLPRRPPISTAAPAQGYPATDLAGTTWFVTVISPTTGLLTYIKFANDTATYAFGVAWAPSGDTAYTLAQIQDTVVTAAGSGVMTQTYSRNTDIVPVNGGLWSSPSSWFASGGKAAASLAEWLMLPDAADAQVIPPPQWPVWVEMCPSQSASVFFNGLIAGGSFALAMLVPSTPTWLIAVGGGGLFGQSLGDFARCAGGGGGADSSFQRHPIAR